MPICGRTPRECFDIFTEHMRGLVAATVTSRYPLIDSERKFYEDYTGKRYRGPSSPAS